MESTSSPTKHVRFALPTPDVEDHMEELESTIVQLTDTYNDTLKDISNVNRLLSEKVRSLSDELEQARKELNMMEKKILDYNLHHPLGLINRRYFDFYMMSAVNRPATDKEWARFCKEFTFNTDKLNLAVYKWIEKVTGIKQIQGDPHFHK